MTVLSPDRQSLIALLAPHAGKWVAVERPWRKVLAADADPEACVRRAQALLGAAIDSVPPQLCYVPVGAANVAAPHAGALTREVA